MTPTSCGSLDPPARVRLLTPWQRMATTARSCARTSGRRLPEASILRAHTRSGVSWGHRPYFFIQRRHAKPSFAIHRGEHHTHRLSHGTRRRVAQWRSRARLEVLDPRSLHCGPQVSRHRFGCVDLRVHVRIGWSLLAPGSSTTSRFAASHPTPIKAVETFEQLSRCPIAARLRGRLLP